MVGTMSSIVLYSMPIAILFETLKMLWHLPIKRDCLRALFRRCGWKELSDWAKTLPWDHPVARSLDQEVHRRKMAGESPSFFSLPWVWVFFPYTPFSLFIDVFPGIDFMMRVLWPVDLCLCPRRARLNWSTRFWVPRCCCRFSRQIP